MTQSTHRLTVWAAVLATAVLATACGGGGGGERGPAVAAIADQSISQDTTLGPLTVRAESVATMAGADVAFSVSSSNPALIPPESIALNGNGAERSLTLTPASDQTGTAQLTVTVRDAAGRMASRSFTVIVNPVFAAFPGFATTAFAGTEGDAPKSVTGLTFQGDMDDNPDAFDALLQ